MMPRSCALTTLFSLHTRNLFQILLEISFGLLQYVFHFLFITLFHSWHIGRLSKSGECLQQTMV